MTDKPNSTFRLRPLAKEDLETVTPWFQDVEDLARFDRTSRIPLNFAKAEEFWSEAISASGNCTQCWFVVESDSGQILGMTGLEAISQINRDAVIAMFVEKSARRLGVGIRATALLIDFGFRQLGLNRMTSYYRSDNNNSRDLVAKLGCQIEGTMRQAWYADGSFQDMVVVGLLKQDWTEHRMRLAKELGNETIVTFGSGSCPKWSWPPNNDGCE